MIRIGTSVTVITAGSVRRIIAFSGLAFHRVRANVGVFHTVVVLNTFRAVRRQFAGPRHAAIRFVRRTAHRARRKRPPHAGFVCALIRVRTSVAVIAAGGIRWVVTFARRAFHRIRAYIGILRAIAGLNTFRAVGRQFAFAGHPTIRFIRRTADRARGERTADAGFVLALIRTRALIIIRAAGRVRRVIAFARRALDGIRTHIGVVGTITGLNTFRAVRRQFARSRHTAIRFVCRTAHRARRKGSAHASFVRTLIRVGTGIEIVTTRRISGVDTFAARTFHGVCAYVRIFRTIAGLNTFGAVGRQFAGARHPAIRLIRRAAHRARCERTADTDFALALIGSCALIPIRTAGRIRRIIAFAGRTLDRIRANIGIFRTIAGLNTFRTVGRQLALARHPAKRFIGGAAHRTGCKRPADAGFI